MGEKKERGSLARLQDDLLSARCIRLSNVALELGRRGVDVVLALVAQPARGAVAREALLAALLVDLAGPAVVAEGLVAVAGDAQRGRVRRGAYKHIRWLAS